MQGYLKVSIQITGPGDVPQDFSPPYSGSVEANDDIERYKNRKLSVPNTLST